MTEQPDQRTPQAGPSTDQTGYVTCTVSCLQTGSDDTITGYEGVDSGDSLDSTLDTRDPRAGFKENNITHRDTDMEKHVNIPSTGGTIIFRETEISSIGDMIKRWEELEKSEVEADTSGGQRISRGKRVSELSLKFEEGRPLSGRGDQEGGKHTNVPEGRTSSLRRGHPTAFMKYNSPSKVRKPHTN